MSLISVPDRTYTLQGLVCPGCHGVIAGIEVIGKARSATSYGDCLRKCSKCQIGASNTRDPHSVTYIYADPIKSIPVQSRDGARKALANSLNVRNRQSKLTRFGFFPTSEDAVTWVVFTYLLRSGKLLTTLQGNGLIPRASAAITPRLLLWGSPVDGYSRGEEIEANLIRACLALGESPQSFSEPDVIVDLGDGGIVFIEVKHGSGNDCLNDADPRWDKYLSGDSASWISEDVKRTGCYELTRNWVLLNRLADGRDAALVNLGPASLFRGDDGKKLTKFAESLRSDAEKTFRQITWDSFLAGNSAGETWFAEFCENWGVTTGRLANSGRVIDQTLP